MRLSSLFLLLFLFTANLTAQSWWGDKTVRGNGNVITEQRSINGDFSEVEASTGLKVELTPSATYALEVTADENLLQYIETEVSNGKLRVRYQKGIQIKNSNRGTVYVKMPELTSVDANSAAIIETNGTFKGEELRVDCGSAAQAKIDFSGQRIKAECGSAGRIELSGTTNEIRLESGSAGIIDAEDCTAKVGRARANSAGSVRIRATNELDAEASSAGNIRYHGNPEKVYTDANSGGAISRSRS